jgi:Initiator Replication protein
MRKNPVKPTGNLINSDDKTLTTLPVPSPVVFTQIYGTFNALDRKLWILLAHIGFDELLTKSKIGEWHEIKETTLRQIMTKYSGTRGMEWLWQAAKRLSQTTVEFECDHLDVRYQGITSMFSAMCPKKEQRDGIFRYMFPAPLVPILLEPGRFARLRVSFLLGLQSKYAVTLYQLLETVANMREPILNATVDQLREWLKVSEGKLQTWNDFNKHALTPALREINFNPELSGINVTHELVRSGKGGKVQRIKFIVAKTDERIDFENNLQTPRKSQSVLPFSTLEKSSTIKLEVLDEELKEILDHFAATFRLPHQKHPSQNVINETQSVLDKYGIKKTKFLIEFARHQSLTTNYSPKTFCGITQYIDTALEVYEEQERIKRKKAVEKLKSREQQIQNARDQHQQMYRNVYFNYIESLSEAVMYRYPSEFVEFQKKESFLLQNIEQEIEAATKKTRRELLETKRRVLTGQRMRIERLLTHFEDHPTVKIPDFWTWDKQQNPESFERRRG